MEIIQEEWRPLNGEFHGWPYEVSSLGRVKSIRSGKLLKQFANNRNYLRVAICRCGVRKDVLVHRLVICAFVGISELEANHIDGCTTNNRADNLEWVTPSENYRHAVQIGTRMPLAYERRQFAEVDIRDIRQSKDSIRKLAARYGVAYNAIRLIRTRQTYREIA